MKKLTLAIGAVSVLASSAVIWAGNLTVPNSFTKNTTISASEMNANFAAVKNEVDDNDQKIKANVSSIQSNASKLSALDAKISGSPNCPEGMAQVGAICVDIYEASVVDSNGNPVDATQAAIDGCEITGKGCRDVIVARSVKDADPAVNFNWFQANLACANAGKRLLTNAEWQAAASGTFDPGNDNDGNTNSRCNTSSLTKSIRQTGLAGSLADQENSCVSDWGVEDMVGNVNEFVADWMPGNGAQSNATHGGTTWGNDRSKVDSIGGNAVDDSKFPAVILRGGSWGDPGVFSFDAFRQPTITGNDIGFRCAKSL